MYISLFYNVVYMLANKHPLVLKKEKTALIIIDIQPSLFPLVAEKEKVLKNLLKLIDVANVFKIPVFLSEQYPKGLGTTIPEIQKAISRNDPIIKTEFSCFRNDGFFKILKNHPDIDTLIVTGIETHICVSQTVLDAIVNKYQVHLVADATSSRNLMDKQIGLDKMRTSGAVISSVEMLIYELLESKDAHEFKDILKIVKQA